jgi:AcrR family transcriptional regulator
MAPRNPRARRGPGRPARPIRREKILSVARGVFAECGYAAASTTRLAELMGLTKASLFHHVRSKEELYLEVVRETLGRLGELVEEAREQDGSFVERIDRLADDVTEFLAAQPDAARLLTWEVVGSGPFMEHEGANAVQLVLGGVSAFVEAAMDRGEIPRQDPQHLALSMAALHVYYFAAAEQCGIFLGEPVSHPDQVEARKKAVRHQIRAICGAQDPDRS